jgi:hypothetical protein
MSFAEQNLEAFIDLLKTQPGLFSQENIVNLKQFISNIPDDTEQLSTAIATWYQRHSKILDAQLNILNKFLNTTGSGSGINIDKNTLLNAIQQSSAKARDKNKNNRRS